MEIYPGMIPSDNEEMEASGFQLGELIDKLYGTGFCNTTDVRNMMGLIGGWAVHLTINEHWKERFGREYLQSRDIDVFFHCDGEKLMRFSSVLAELGYQPHSNNRYLKILNRLPDTATGRRYLPVGEEEAKKMASPFLIYHFVDLFCGNACPEQEGVCGKFHSWKMERLKNFYTTAKVLRDFSHPILVPDLHVLLELKADMILSEDREAGKKVKDMCDFVALTYNPGFAVRGWRHVVPGQDRIADAVEAIRGFENKPQVSENLFRDQDVRTLDSQLDVVVKALDRNQ